MSDNCIFCKIIKGDIPGYKIYEDDDFIVILDRFPKSIGHSLIITKSHAVDLFELDEDIAAKIMPLACKISKILKDTFQFDGINVMQNNGKAAGQEVLHYHLHLMPRYEKDKNDFPHKTIDISEKELEEMVKNIASKQ